MAKRALGLSLLDWLWTNYGLYEISDTITSGTIPTSDAVLEVLSSLLETDTSLLELITANSDSIVVLLSTDSSLLLQITSNDEDIAALLETDVDLQSLIRANDEDIAALLTSSSDLQDLILSNDKDIAALQAVDETLQSNIDEVTTWIDSNVVTGNDVDTYIIEVEDETNYGMAKAMGVE